MTYREAGNLERRWPRYLGTLTYAGQQGLDPECKIKKTWTKIDNHNRAKSYDVVMIRGDNNRWDRSHIVMDQNAIKVNHQWSVI